MKAKVKATGEMVEVEKRMLQFADGSTEIYYRDIYSSNGRFKEEELTEMVDDFVIFPTDWKAYRNEIAKECLAAAFANGNQQWIGVTFEERAKYAVDAADALIKRLKGDSE